MPLPVRFAGIRLDKIQKALDLGEEKIATKEMDAFQQQIKTLPRTSVLIQEASSDLHQLEEPNFWTALSHQKIEFLRQRIKPLFKVISQVDFKAMRFEKDMLETSLAKLANETHKFDFLKINLMEQIGQLPLSVNIVARESTLIENAQTNHFWATITDDDMDFLSQKLAPLMKFRQTSEQPMDQAHFNLKDLVHTKEIIEFGPGRAAVGIAAYQAMVEQMIQKLSESNPILQKIRNNQPVSESEANHLAQILNDEHPHITEALLQKAYQNKKATFLQFIRHILGLEKIETFPDTVAALFDQFFKAHTELNTRQLDFLNLLKEFILERETVQKKDLIKSPFTIIHPQGIRGLFSPNQIEQILQLAQNIAA